MTLQPSSPASGDAPLRWAYRGDARSRIQGRRPGQPGKIEKAKDARRALLRLVPYLGFYKVTLGMVLVLVVI